MKTRVAVWLLLFSQASKLLRDIVDALEMTFLGKLAVVLVFGTPIFFISLWAIDRALMEEMRVRLKAYFTKHPELAVYMSTLEEDTDGR